MKKFILVIFLFLVSFPVLAQDLSDGTTTKQADIIQDSDTEGADDFYRELIAPDYGSDQSPAFLNRENVNPNESNYSSGYSDASECDPSNDSGNYAEPGD